MLAQAYELSHPNKKKERKKERKKKSQAEREILFLLKKKAKEKNRPYSSRMHGCKMSPKRL